MYLQKSKAKLNINFYFFSGLSGLAFWQNPKPKQPTLEEIQVQAKAYRTFRLNFGVSNTVKRG